MKSCSIIRRAKSLINYSEHMQWRLSVSGTHDRKTSTETVLIKKKKNHDHIDFFYPAKL